MNGVHDMGGMQGFGPILPEQNEPVFHARWEGRVLALNNAMAVWGKWNIDRRRYVRELIPASEFLAMSYYQIWYTGLITNMLDAGMVTRAEIDSGKPAPGSPKMTPPLTATRVPAFFDNGAPKIRNLAVVPKFQVGQQVRARNINPQTHTRLPRYARGKMGTVQRDHGVFVFPDTNAQFLGEKPQHLYSVRFGARELWGDEANPKDTVIIAMWNDYLEPA